MADTKKPDGFALDRASARSYDANGYLHVERSNISKATVNGYYGAEIPGADELGLEPGRIYQLLRDPEELKRAADTFNNVPILIQHAPVSPVETQKDLVIGSTGTDAKFDGTYLTNSLVFWDATAIGGIESAAQQELSCGYRYRADMTAGSFNGTPYDGVMRDLRGNHVALVEMGRAGPDVMVGDSQPPKDFKMKLTRKAMAVHAAVGAHLRPLLAQDARVADLGALVRELPAKVDDKAAQALAAKVITATNGKLAADKALDKDQLAHLVKMAADESDDFDAEDEEDDEERKKREEREKGGKANDEEDPDEKNEKKDKAAMDAALSRARSEGAADGVRMVQAIREAEKLVAPHVGEVSGMDSAAAVYKFALDQAGVDTKDVDPSAFKAMVLLLPKPGATTVTTKRMAADAAGAPQTWLAKLHA